MLTEQRAKLSRGNDVAKAMDYMLKRWTAFTRSHLSVKQCR
jgi:transposase